VGSAQSIAVAEDLLRRATAPEGADAAMPRAMIVVAHPDDETVALGARIGRFREAHFVHVTDGAPRNEQDSRAYGFATLEEYRQARERELTQMFTKAGLERVSRTRLSIPDQEAALNLAEITRQVARRIAHHEPGVLFTHPFEGGHPDHDACAFATHHAVELHRSRGGTRPLILEAPFYNAGRSGFEAGRFLPEPQSMAEVAYNLSAEERQRKHALVACFTTQQETLRGFHDATERYRIAPVYDFTRPPHPGRVLYDNYPWGMKSERFSELAEQAEARYTTSRDHRTQAGCSMTTIRGG
jgi:LmbE family N-acetylglucosaminyl deacetylase